MVLCQRQINIVTNTSDMEIWDKTDQICKLLTITGFTYVTLDTSDSDDEECISAIVEVEKIKNKNILLPFFAIDNKIIGNIGDLYTLINNKKIISMARYYN
jgi:hypothetical protein